MTLKEIVRQAIEMGMETFQIKHFRYNGRVYEVAKESVFEWIKSYENALPVSCYFGSAYSTLGEYERPTLCYITYRFENENLK